MGITADITQDFYAALAALDWQIDCGADEAIGDLPVDRFTAEAAPAIPDIAPKIVAAPMPQPVAQADGQKQRAVVVDTPSPKAVNPVEAAEGLAKQSNDIETLARNLQGFELCQLRKGARNTVFRDGVLGADVMVLAEPPNREEDLEGLPFVGAAGILLERMFGAIGLSRSADNPTKGVYLGTTMPWRPLGQTPDPEDLAMLRPFVLRHISLAAPKVLVITGPVGLEMVTGQRSMLRSRGQWLKTDRLSLPNLGILPIWSPVDLMRNTGAKAEAWADLLLLQAKLRQLRG